MTYFKKYSYSPIQICLLVLFLVNSCAPISSTFDPAGATLLYEGSFSNGAHTTSGSAKIYSKNGGKTLVLESFKTDSGPDLYVYLSTSTSGITVSKNLGTLKATSGMLSYDLSSDADPDQTSQVLIWCKAYSVLFGSAKLTKK